MAGQLDMLIVGKGDGMMRKRKMILGLGMLASVLVLGVGYAVVSEQTLNVTGDATVKAHTMNVIFTGATIDGGNENTALITDGLNATIDVKSLSKIGDEVTATYTIKNNEPDLDAEVSQISATVDKQEYFTVSTVDAACIQKEKTGTVQVIVRLIKMPIEGSDATTSVNVQFQASPLQPQD